MKPTLLFHVQHFLGIGHLVRAFALAEALTSEFRVVIVSGGTFPAGIDAPENVDVVGLPALGFDADRVLVSHDAEPSVAKVLAKRKERLLEIYDDVRPDLLLVELFPFGRKKLADELLALLRRARSHPNPPFVATSLRDLLVTGRHDQQRHDDRAASIAERFIDLVLVHSDQRFATLDLSFRPALPFTVPVTYTGFVAGVDTGRAPPSEITPGTVVVSAGGGWVGGALMGAALDAAPTLAARHGVRTTLITGPLADRQEQELLQKRGATRPMVDIVGSVPGLLPTLRRAAASVSQAGYNTTVDLLRSQVPSVLVPYGDQNENEQPRRAARLAEHGLAHVVDPSKATGDILADAVSAVINNPPPRAPWALDGATTTAALLRSSLAAVGRRAG